MKTRIILLIAILFLLCGCSGSQGETQTVDENIIITPDKEKTEVIELNGEKVYKYKDYYFLTEYGIPELTGQDIEKLIDKINEGDYETVRKAVKTIPDFINLFINSGFKPNKAIVSTDQ